MDELDLAIVQHLRSEGRKPYTEIAEALGVSEGTVRNRVARLMEERALHIVGLMDPYHMGIEAPALIGVSLQPGDLEQAVEAIAALEEVSYLVMVSGEFDLIVEVMCRDRDHLVDFLNEDLRRIPGVMGTRTFTILRTYKMAYGAPSMLESPSEEERERA